VGQDLVGQGAGELAGLLHDVEQAGGRARLVGAPPETATAENTPKARLRSTSGFETAMAAVFPASVRSRSQCERRCTADHGDVREDLLDPLRRMAAMVNSATGCALQCLLAEVDRDHQLNAVLHGRGRHAAAAAVVGRRPCRSGGDPFV
jgi:hypothetical protein